jgi:hypothetical protein
MVKEEEKKKTDEEEIKEIYEIEKDGKESIIETSGIIKEEIVKKGKIKEENKTLRNILVFLGVAILILIVVFFISRSPSHFKYKGLEFTTISQGELIFYNATIPVIYEGDIAYYITYLRNDPRELRKEVHFEGELTSVDNTVINLTQEFDCDGNQMIAIANLVNLYEAINKTIIKDENANCDELGRYMYLVIQPGNETSIEQFGPNCYNININNCEILEGTERFIAEMLVKINSNIYEK